MPRAKFQTLTEQMFYILLCLKDECCGMDILDKVRAMTDQRVNVGSGTLYNLLEQFLEAGMIRETKVEGRRRSYLLTEKGREMLEREYARLNAQAMDYRRMFGEGGSVMREMKKQFERFAFYDKNAIEKKMEAMAAQGWLIEQPGNYRWRYRRIEPKKLHICVTYFPNASDFDPHPTEGQQQMEDFCARDGWVLIARWGQMQIFCSEQEDPTPIETDPVTQVETIHRAMKKNMIPTHVFLLAVCLYQFAFTVWRLKTDPIDFLSTPVYLLLTADLLLMFLPALLELCWYFRWYHKAKKNAENGLFGELKTNHTASLILVGVSMLLILLTFLCASATRWALMVGLLLVLIVVGVTGAIKDWMKRRGVSRAMNRTLSVGISAGLTLILAMVLVAFMLRTGFTGGSKPVGTYDLGGWSAKVYADPMPLYVQDLTETGCTDWSTEARENESFLLSCVEYDQWPLTRERGVPNLEYTVVEVKSDVLYEYCKNSLIHSREDEVRDGEVLLADHYDPVDAAPWGANEAYRVYFSDGYINRYLLCYQNRLIEIRLDWEPTAEQCGIIAEKLSGI